MFKDRFKDREGVGPILISMILGLLVVLLVGGFILNFIGNLRKNVTVKTQGTKKEVIQPQAQDTQKVNILDRIKQKLTSIKTTLSGQKGVITKEAAQTSNITGVPSSTDTQTIAFMDMLSKSKITDLNAEKGQVFTILMPNDQAFANAKDAIQQLIGKNDNASLQAFVKRHIVSDRVTGGAVKTLSNEDVYIDFSQNTVTFGTISARIIEKRGDVLILDKVLY